MVGTFGRLAALAAAAVLISGCGALTLRDANKKWYDGFCSPAVITAVGFAPRFPEVLTAGTLPLDCTQDGSAFVFQFAGERSFGGLARIREVPAQKEPAPPTIAAFTTAVDINGASAGLTSIGFSNSDKGVELNWVADGIRYRLVAALSADRVSVDDVLRTARSIPTASR